MIPLKVKVPKLHKPTGPRNVFGSKHPSPQQTFDILFTHDMWNQIVEQTNKYEGPRLRYREG